MAKGGKRTFGSKPKGKAKQKGAKGNASKRKTGSKIKTKARTANRSVKKSQQRVAKEKATAPTESLVMDSTEMVEAEPSSVSDEIEAPNRFPAAA